MEFYIADTFADSLSRLTGEEQKAVKTTAFDLQMNPANPGMKFHKLDRAKDKNFWSIYVNKDIRLIVHKSSSSLIMCYVNHHDKAYEWAERRKMEIHPRTGAAQLVEIRELVKEIIIPVYKDSEKEKVEPEYLFKDLTDEELLGYGVPIEWLSDVRSATEDTLLLLVEHLPTEASEALLELAVGSTPVNSPALINADPLEHPDSQRRFRIMANVEELTLALEYPWDKWTIFLHPDQRQLVTGKYDGPVRISGSAGTGKTIVALHRVAHLAKKYPEARILLTTFSDTLANSLKNKLRRLIGSEPKLAERIEVYSINEIGLRLFKSLIGPAIIADSELLNNLIKEASASTPNHKFNLRFLFAEWEQVIDGWQLEKWEDYKNVVRLGRKTKLLEEQRKILWSIFGKVKNYLSENGLFTYPQLFNKLTCVITKTKLPVFDFAVIDESQDISVCHLRFLAAMSAGHSSSLFFTGDLGQRIFQQPFSWKSQGIDIRGRSKTLKINYRTSHQIRSQADKLLDQAFTDLDGNREIRNGTISLFNGPEPQIHTFKSINEEISFVAGWLKNLQKDGIKAHEIGIFIRSGAQLERAISAANIAKTVFKVLDDKVETTNNFISICTMHLAKGLEFRAVAVMACDDEILPLQERIESVGEYSDLQEVYDTERQLLYVAITRARDNLIITGVEPVSEFLDDLQTSNTIKML